MATLKLGRPPCLNELARTPLQATANATMAGGQDAAQPKPFDSMDMLRAMQGASSSTAPRQIGYGGADSERQWAEEQKDARME